MISHTAWIFYDGNIMLQVKHIDGIVLWFDLFLTYALMCRLT